MNKKNISDLAYFGGTPLFSSPRPHGQLALPKDSAFFNLARSIYFNQQSTDNHPLARELERRLSDIHQTKHCIVFANACLALILLMDILADGRHGEVIMPAFTYAGLPHLAQWAGQKPRFCDVDWETHTLDPTGVEENICEETTAILAVHNVNSPCQIDELEAIATQHDTPIIFDSVHAIHCSYKGQPIGCFGKAEVFSLHATKLLNGFEGGYVTSNDSNLAETLRMKRNFGMDENGEVTTMGLDARLNEIHAVCALASIEQQAEIIERNRQRFLAYNKYFSDIPGLEWVPYRNDDEKINYEYPLLLVDPSWPIQRDTLVTLLRAENALVRPYYSSTLHLLGQFSNSSEPPPSLPITEALSRMIIHMPAGELLNEEDIKELGALMKFIYVNSHNILERLSPRGRHEG